MQAWVQRPWLFMLLFFILKLERTRLDIAHILKTGENMKNTMFILLALLLPACVCAQQDVQTPKHILRTLDKQIQKQMTIGLHRAATEELLNLLKSPQAKRTQNLQRHVRHLVEAGANVNGQDKDGNRVFTLALRTGDVDTVKYLVGKGVRFINLACPGAGSDYLTALSKKSLCQNGKALREPLVYANDVELAKFFRGRKEAAARPSMPALAEAVSAGNEALAKYYIDWFGVNISNREDRRTALHVLAQRNDLGGVKFLLRNGANPTARDAFGRTPAAETSSSEIQQLLNVASENWRLDFPLHRAVRKNDVKTAALLVDAGADINEGLASDGRTPLIDAARFNKKDAVDFLLKKGADVNKASSQGYTPLHWVVLQSNGKLSMLKRLVKAGADLNAQDEQGNTPLYYAVKYGEELKVGYLMKKGARADIKNKAGESAAQLLAQKAAAAAEAQRWSYLSH